MEGGDSGASLAGAQSSERARCGRSGARGEGGVGRKALIVVFYRWASLVAQMVKHLPAIQDTWVRSLGQEDPLEKEMSTHSSILAWKIP